MTTSKTNWYHHLRSLSLATALLLPLLTMQALAQTSQTHCRLGMMWQNNTPWGKGYPVITDVEPSSPTDRSGLKRGDIITAIDGYSTLHISQEDLAQLLHAPETHHILKVSSIGRSSREVLLTPECRPAQHIAERELAELFSTLSPEHANSLTLRYPYRFASQQSIDPTELRTFAFAPLSAGAIPSIEEEIQDAVKKELRALGLREDVSGKADLIVHSFYSLAPIETIFEIRGPSGVVNTIAQQQWRYDPDDRQLSLLPILAKELPDCYSLELTIELRHTTSNKVIWSASSNESIGLSRVPPQQEYYDWWQAPRGQGSPLSLEEYCRVSIPVMMQAFPIAPSQSIAQVHLLEYHYTGLVFNKLDLTKIVDVHPISPAAKAGLRAGDRIRTINGLSLPEGAVAAVWSFYQRLSSQLEEYRDTSLPKLSSELGEQSSLLWRSDKHLEILDELSRPKARMGFGYLFSFAPYIPSLGERIVFEIDRSGRSYRVEVVPERRSESRVLMP